MGVHRYGHDSYGVARVLELSQRNIAALELPIEILNTDYRSGLAHVSLGSDDLLIAFIAPPWGAALISATGLDLDATTPAVAEIVDSLIDRFPRSRMLCAIQTYEMMNAESVASVRRRFDWSKTALYRLNAPAQNHGVLLAPGAGRLTLLECAPPTRQSHED